MKKRQHHIIQTVCIVAILILVAVGGFLYSHHMRLHEFLERSRHQIQYSLFNNSCNDTIVVGHHKELFLRSDLDNITGKHLQYHYQCIDSAKAEALRNIQATLTMIDTLHRHGTEFLFVFCPYKPAVYPEYLPKIFYNEIADFSLVNYYIELCKEKGIPHIDFYNYFQSIKKEFPYPLYAQTGSHWAESTIPFICDTLFRKMEALTGYQLPSINIIDNNISTDYSIQDKELEKPLGLLFPISKPAIPRPIFALADTVGKDRPHLLVVGDGYYNQISQSCFVDAFRQADYWIYNKSIRSTHPYYDQKQTNNIFDAAEVFEDTDIVMAMFSPNYLFNYLCGFIPYLHEQLQHGNYSDEEIIAILINKIKLNQEWYQSVEQQAQDLGITVDENLLRHAQYLFENMKQSKATN